MLKKTAPVSAEIRTQHAVQAIQSVGWQEHTIDTGQFVLKAYGTQLKTTMNDVLTIYIEGDGLAWISNDFPSENPTPLNPIGLKIAIQDKKNYPIVYLARPCQFALNTLWRSCRSPYWTHLRFSSEIIHSMNQAVDYLKNFYRTKQIILIGYSGGGTIAALMSARRNDVIKLITLAAILDIKEWVDQKSLTPLHGSLNPTDVWKELVSIPQTHWVGEKDNIVPKEIAFNYAKHFPAEKKPKIIVVPEFDHVCCWATGLQFS